MAPNIRQLLNWTDGYHQICREERNVAAIFYHALLLHDNLQRFLDLIGCELEVNPEQLGIFFEYAYLRDLWNKRVNDKAVTRKLILTMLDLPDAERFESMGVLEFNEYFGAVPKASAEFIQSPGNWSIGRYKENIADDEFFLAVCKFKWAFNAKPDIVIHTSNDAAVCVEARFASGEGQYPAKADEVAEFKRREVPRVGQTELQKFILEDLLGVKTDFVFLVQDPKAKSGTHVTVTWADVFGGMDLAGAPKFVREWVERL